MQNSLKNASIIGGIGSILAALSIFPLGIIGIILIIASFHTYSKALNNPSIFRFGSRWGIIILLSSLVLILLIGISVISADSTFWAIISLASLYVLSIYSVVELERALIELSKSLNHNLFKIAG